VSERIFRNAGILCALVLIVGLLIHFGMPYYTMYSAKQSLKELDIVFSEQKFIDKACAGDEGAVLLFLKAGINVQAIAVPSKSDGIAKGALHCAAYKGQPMLVKALLLNGADPNLLDDEGNTVIYYAVRSAKLYQSDKKEVIDILTQLVAKGANVNISGKNGLPIVFAAQSGSIEILDFLLTKGADPKAAGENGQTLLMALSSHNNRKNFSELETRIRSWVKGGVDVNATNKAGQTALMLALSSRNQDLVQLLLELGANPNIGDQNGQFPIYVAMNDPELFQLLVSKGADVNIKNGRYTLLHQAIVNNNQRIVQLLLSQKGVDINGKTDDGETAVHLAVMRRNQMLLQQLLASGADANLTNRSLQSPLIRAVLQDDYLSVKTLLEWGADVNVRDGSNRTALSYAKSAQDNLAARYGGSAYKGAPQEQRMIIGDVEDLRRMGLLGGDAMSAAEAAPSEAAPGARNYYDARRLSAIRTQKMIQQQAARQQPPQKPQNTPMVDLLLKYGAKL
jgi:ankyrin repeat protein